MRQTTLHDASLPSAFACEDWINTPDVLGRLDSGLVVPVVSALVEPVTLVGTVDIQLVPAPETLELLSNMLLDKLVNILRSHVGDCPDAEFANKLRRN